MSVHEMSSTARACCTVRSLKRQLQRFRHTLQIKRDNLPRSRSRDLSRLVKIAWTPYNPLHSSIPSRKHLRVSVGILFHSRLCSRTVFSLPAWLEHKTLHSERSGFRTPVIRHCGVIAGPIGALQGGPHGVKT